MSMPSWTVAHRPRRKRYGCTALHYAACNRKPEFIEALLAGGAGVGLVSKQETAPLHLAASDRQTNVANALLAGHEQTETRDQNGYTALEARSPMGTALKQASRNNHLEVVQTQKASRAHTTSAGRLRLTVLNRNSTITSDRWC